MRALSVYFNELSSKCTTNEVEATMEEAVRAMFACVRAVSECRPEVGVVMPRGAWHEIIGSDRLAPLGVWIKRSLRHDQFAWLLAKIKHDSSPCTEDCELFFEEQRGAGLLLAYLAGSWVLSLAAEGDKWASHSLEAIEYRIDTEGEWVEARCTLRHLACMQHADYWRGDLYDYGSAIAENNIVCHVEGLAVAMFPLDHGYPHVHLVNTREAPRGRSPLTIAKYRVDIFERMEGGPQFDSIMRDLIRAHRDLLMRSWERCRRGGQPFQIQTA
jgi:hypothetical protein